MKMVLLLIKDTIVEMLLLLLDNAVMEIVLMLLDNDVASIEIVLLLVSTFASNPPIFCLQRMCDTLRMTDVI